MPLRAVTLWYVAVEFAGFVGRMLSRSVSLGDGTAFVSERHTRILILLGESMILCLVPKLEHSRHVRAIGT
jgi:hypothetical protein